VVRRFLTWLGTGRFGSVRLALVLAVPTLPIVTWAVANPVQTETYRGPAIAYDDALVMSVLGLVAAALAGGFVGGRLARHATISIFTAVAVAWFVGLASLSVTSSLLGIRYQGFTICIGACSSFISSRDAFSGVIAWGIAAGMTTSMVIPPVIGVLALIGSRSSARAGEIASAAVLAVAGHAFFLGMAFVVGGAPAVAAYVCLGIGVIVWAQIVVAAPVKPAVPVEPIAVPNSA
jgi:hypothetical protein